LIRDVSAAKVTEGWFGAVNWDAMGDEGVGEAGAEMNADDVGIEEDGLEDRSSVSEIAGALEVKERSWTGCEAIGCESVDSGTWLLVAKTPMGWDASAAGGVGGGVMAIPAHSSIKSN
jgi:hypothetical protein